MNNSIAPRRRVGPYRPKRRSRNTDVPDALVEEIYCAIRKAIRRLPYDVPEEWAPLVSLHRLGMAIGEKVQRSAMRGTVDAQVRKALSAAAALDCNASIDETEVVAKTVIRAARATLPCQRKKYEAASKIMEIGLAIWQEEQLAKDHPKPVRSCTD